jgi:hypothetical protein
MRSLQRCCPLKFREFRAPYCSHPTRSYYFTLMKLCSCEMLIFNESDCNLRRWPQFSLPYSPTSLYLQKVTTSHGIPCSMQSINRQRLLRRGYAFTTGKSTIERTGRSSNVNETPAEYNYSRNRLSILSTSQRISG